jgi:hypothetical protein
MGATSYFCACLRKSAANNSFAGSWQLWHLVNVPFEANSAKAVVRNRELLNGSFEGKRLK